MPWFAVDDGFDTHPKVRKAGNAAVGLFCRLGSHSAKHLTEGVVDGVLARSIGTGAQLRRLVDVGMLHEHSHRCQRCVQPAEGDYVMHDYLDYNRSRKQIENARENGRKRQSKGRDQQRQARNEAQPSPDRGPSEPQVNLGWGSVGPQNETRFPEGSAGQGGMSRRYTLEGDAVVPSQPIPSSSFRTAARGGEQAAVAGLVTPEWAQPLLDELGARDMSVSWRLSPMQWIAVQQLINTRGVPFLVEQARRRWNPKDPIKFASLLIQIWTEIPAPPQARAARESAQRDAHCGDPDCDEISRTRDIEVGDGLKASVPCSACHPNRKERAA